MAQAISPQIDKSVAPSDLETLCATTGPCITILLPKYSPGAASSPEIVTLKQLLRTAPELPAFRKMVDSGSALLNPLRELEDAPELQSGGAGLALYSAPGFVAGFRYGGEAKPKLTMGNHAFIRPLLEEALTPAEVFALGLSRKHTRLFRCRHGNCEELDLPPGVSASLVEALDTDEPDHDLANRSASGSSTGSPFAVRFGTGSERERAPEYLHNYFALLDRGLHPLLKAAPVFLMGVAEEIAAFRKAARHLSLLEQDSPGSAEIITPLEVVRKTHQAALYEYCRRGEAVLAQFREMPDRSRTSSTLSQIVTAAEQGRVHEAVLADEAEIPAAHRKQLIEGEDVLNAIAVQTIRNGGNVFTLSAKMMSDLAPVAAIFRY